MNSLIYSTSDMEINNIDEDELSYITDISISFVSYMPTSSKYSFSIDRFIIQETNTQNLQCEIPTESFKAVAGYLYSNSFNLQENIDTD
jgi:hypothetical protein